MSRLGSFEPSPRLAIGVSGGADSTCLALLAADWARARGGSVLALIVDHGLRPGSDAEAMLTRTRLAGRGIDSRVLTLRNLAPGAAIAARARTARLQALVTACRADGIVHLLLGHHAGDQAETVAMRGRAGSGRAGLAAMAALRELPDLRVLRPLLDTSPAALRAHLRACGVGWIEDPSNTDPGSERARLRATLDPPRAAILHQRGEHAAVERVRTEATIAAELAERASVSPLGYALLTPGAISPAALSALWQALSDRPYPPPARAIAALAAAPRPATLAGLRLRPAGRLGPGWLIIAEQAPLAMAATHGARWGRFTFRAPREQPAALIAAVGEPPKAVRRDLPADILRLLPALFRDSRLAAIPALGWCPDPVYAAAAFAFTPAVPATSAPWIGSLLLRDA